MEQNPYAAPKSRVAAYPTSDMAESKITSNHIA